MPIGIQNLKFPSFIDLAIPSTSHIVSEINGTQISVGTHLWWVCTMTIIRISIGFLAVLYYLYAKRQQYTLCRRKEHGAKESSGQTRFLYPQLPLAQSEHSAPSRRGSNLRRSTLMTALGNAEVSYKAHTGIATIQVDMDTCMGLILNLSQAYNLAFNFL